MNALKKINKMEKKTKSNAVKKKAVASKKMTKKPTIKSAVIKIKPAKLMKTVCKSCKDETELGSIIMRPKIETAEHWRRERLKERG